MRLIRRASFGTLAIAASAFAAQPGDIVLTPAAGGGVSITDATGATTRLRVADDGSVTIPGVILKGGNSFIHNSGTANSFFGLGAGNFTMTGANNTGIGGATLLSNITGHENTAVGGVALLANTGGFGNTALGYGTLFANLGGSSNTATGMNALRNNTNGSYNAAFGIFALYANQVGSSNTALGHAAMSSLTSGNTNTAVGESSLPDATTGGNNIAIGLNAGSGIVAGDFNIAIGANSAGDESGTIRIGRAVQQNRTFIAGIRGITTGVANAIPVLIDNNGQLGTLNSSERFKDDIADMGEATDALMQLRPVTFHYKADQDPAGRTLQYGLIAEEVAQVYPGLVAHSPDGQVETVMVQFLPAMLLNETQKQRRALESETRKRLALEDETRELRAELAAIKRRLGLP